jgi:hypothetical protein
MPLSQKTISLNQKILPRGPKQLQKKLENACQEIIKTLQLPSFLEASKVAVPENLQVKNLSAHSNFLCIDFAI